jgi:sulfofructose kinase
MTVPAGVLCLGTAVWDRVLSIPDIPRAATRVYASDLTETGGGAAATAACAVARLGGMARLVARVGADRDGGCVGEELARFGVDTAWLRRLPGARTVTSTIALDRAGERLILAFPGRGLQVAPDWVDWDAAFAGMGCVLVDMGWSVAAARALREAAARGIPSVLGADLSPDPDAAALIGLADHVILSATGLAVLAEEEHDVIRGLAKIVARRGGYRGSVGVTLGERGYFWLDDAGEHHSPGFPVRAVATLGAGDVFHGAFALAIAEGQGLVEAARFANAAAAVKCTRPGGPLGAPDRAEVRVLLRRGAPGQPAMR